MAIYTIILTRKKDGNSISRDYELTDMRKEREGTIIGDMKRTIENSTDTKF